VRPYLLPAASLLTLVTLFSSCDKDDAAPAIPNYTVPATYDFTNVEYQEATTRVNMWSGLSSYLGKSTSRQLSQDTANNLWNNTNSPFTSETVVNLQNTSDQLNSASVNIAEKTSDPLLFKSFIDSMVIVSASNAEAASEGVPGKIGNRLVNYSGLEFNQIVAKGLMGAFQLSSILSHLDKVASDDNSTVNPGTGTAMEHDWDMAFGYTSMPRNYDSSIAYANTVTDRPLALGGYFRERGRFIQAGGKIYEAFRKGRAAIAAKDYVVRDQAIATIKEYLEKTIAAAAYEYSGIGLTGGDLAAKFHAMSEAYGFTLALKYRPATSPLTAGNYQALLDIFKSDFYQLHADPNGTKLKQAQSILTSAYGQLQP
jgi:hypothetical protein